MGQKLVFGGYMGECSFPGGDVTYTPPGDLTDNPHPNVFSSQTELEPVFYPDTVTELENYLHKVKKSDRRKIKHARKRFEKIRAIVAQNLPLSTTRSVMGQSMPLSHSAAGVDSFPGPDVTYTPPITISNHMVNLGCLNGTTNTDIPSVTVQWPQNQLPRNYASGAQGPLYADILDGSHQTEAVGAGHSSGRDGSGGQPHTVTLDGVARGDFNTFEIGDALRRGPSTPFQNPVYLAMDIGLYNISSIANGFTSINLAQEGILWTLWPLVRSGIEKASEQGTYFDQFTFGTAKTSRYAIGQMGFFTNNRIFGCTPFGAVNTNSGWNPGVSGGQPGLNPYSPGVLPGIEELNQMLMLDLTQNISVIVVKVSEEVARIKNTVAGVSASGRYIYVGYDGWAVVLTSANPLGPMAAQTYITPQSVTGSVVGENMQVVLPPNFPTTVYYKNELRKVPVNTMVGLFAGTSIGNADSGL